MQNQKQKPQQNPALESEIKESEGTQFETNSYEIDPAELSFLERNARHMPEVQFRRLVANLKRDGVLTSAATVYRVGDKLRILSGNHRVKAAMAAGLKKVPVIEIIGDLPEARQTAIALSHNALVGDDDPNVLKEMYESLDAIEKLYTGLTDEALGTLEPPDLTKITVAPPKLQEVSLMFLPEDSEIWSEHIDRIKRLAERKLVHVAHLETFNKLYDAMVKTKDVLNIGNDAIAFIMMAELTVKKLEEMEDPK